MTRKNWNHVVLSAMALIALSLTCESDTFTPASARENVRTATVPTTDVTMREQEEDAPFIPTPIQAPEVWGTETIRHDWRCYGCPIKRRPEVVQLERALNAVVDQDGERFYDAPFDGVYGRALDQAVGKFQRAMGLKTCNGGVYNNETFLALSRVLYESERVNVRPIVSVDRSTEVRVSNPKVSVSEFGPELTAAAFDNAPTPTIEPLTESDEDFIFRLLVETTDEPNGLTDVNARSDSRREPPITNDAFDSRSIIEVRVNREDLNARFNRGARGNSRR